MEIIFEAVVALFIISCILFLLAVGGFVADHVLCRSKRLDQFFDTLPMSWM